MPQTNSSLQKDLNAALAQVQALTYHVVAQDSLTKIYANEIEEAEETSEIPQTPQNEEKISRQGYSSSD